MRIEEWMGLLSETAKRNEYRFESLRECIPLGVYSDGNIATAHKEEKTDRYHYLMVTGAGKRDFMLRLIASLSCMYDGNRVEFLVLSPYAEYTELLGLVHADVTVPYLKSAEDFEEALKTVESLVAMRAMRKGFPRLFIVAEGLEKIEGLKGDDVTEAYSRCLAAAGRSDTEVIAGIELTESAYASYPGAVIGIGNCLVSVKGGGKADVTQVGADSSLGLPRELIYHSEPSFKEVVSILNGACES